MILLLIYGSIGYEVGRRAGAISDVKVLQCFELLFLQMLVDVSSSYTAVGV